MMSLMASFCAVFFPRDVLDEIWDLIESVSEGFSSFLCNEILPGLCINVIVYPSYKTIARNYLTCDWHVL